MTPLQAVEIGSTTRDIPATYTHVWVRARSHWLTQGEIWGQTVAYVRDADGIRIEICTPMS